MLRSQQTPDSCSTHVTESDNITFTILSQNFLPNLQNYANTPTSTQLQSIYHDDNFLTSSNQNKIDNDYKYIYSFEWNPITKEANAVKSLKSNDNNLLSFFSPILSNFFSSEISSQQLPKASQQQSNSSQQQPNSQQQQLYSSQQQIQQQSNSSQKQQSNSSQHQTPVDIELTESCKKENYIYSFMWNPLTKKAYTVKHLRSNTECSSKKKSISAILI